MSSSKLDTLYLTSRSGTDLPSPSQSSSTVANHVKLDISDISSIEALAELVEKEHGKQSVSALINNAGINVDDDGDGREEIRKTMKTNYYGNVNVSLSILCLDWFIV